MASAWPVTAVMRVMLLVCMLYLQCLLATANERHLIHNFASVLPCNMTRQEVVYRVQNSNVMMQTAHMWASTKHISDWHSTAWVLVSSRDASVDTNMLMYNIPFSESLLHVRYDYISYIHFPSILKSVMDVDVRLPVHKHVFLDTDTIYTITVIDKIPVIGSCAIYTRTKLMDQGVVLSRSVLSYEELPWYVRIFQPAIEGKVQESLLLYNEILTTNLCRSE